MQLFVSSPLHSTCTANQRGRHCSCGLTPLPAAYMSFPLCIKLLPLGLAALSAPHLSPHNTRLLPSVWETSGG